MTLLPHQQRVVDEKIQLDEKLGKLANFLTSRFYGQLPLAEQNRLSRQYQAMHTYSKILHERIENF